jgi:serine/threonine protein kinase
MACHPEKLLYSKKTRRHQVNKVNSGKYGEVFVGCTTRKCNKQIAVKKSLDDMKDEFDVTKRANKLVPLHVVKPYLFSLCKPVGSIMYLEYISGGTIQSSPQFVSKTLLFQVLYTLLVLQRNGIKHNDTHLKNILIDKNFTKKGYTVYPGGFVLKNKGFRAVLSDFGLSNTNIPTHGINPKSDPKYDYHLFLNSIYKLGNLQANNFIKRILPPEYIGETSTKINNYRLRYGVDHSGLPSLRRVLLDPYFKSFRITK